MKSFSSAVVGLFVPFVVAYPQATRSAAFKAQLQTTQNEALQGLAQSSASSTSFNAAAQLIDVSGAHAWQAPGPGDDRGPCPGLNALANHGYLPRNGKASVLDFITATTTVYGMGVDLATVLAVYGAVFDGVLLGWSIGGPGAHQGIGGSHGHYESDNSPMRADLNQYGSNTELVVPQFKTLLDLQPDASTANYDISVLSNFRGIRFNESIAENPYFYYGPFSGTLVTQAAFSFIYRFMANHTAAAPDGILNQDVLKSFFSITGTGDNLTWTPGHERIPDNWYRRSQTSPYGLNPLGDDANTFAAQTPALGPPGCNQGTVNSYTKIDVSYTGYNFSQPQDSVCFALAEILGVVDMAPIVGELVEMLIVPLHSSLGCIGVPASNKTVTDGCPGSSFYGGPTGPVAPGAIQE